MGIFVVSPSRADHFELPNDFIYAKTIKYYSTKFEADIACGAAWRATPSTNEAFPRGCGGAFINGFEVSNFQEYKINDTFYKYGTPLWHPHNIVCAPENTWWNPDYCYIHYFVGGAKCPNGYFLNEEATACEARCLVGQTWDPILGCQDNPEEQTCKNVGPHPIDYMTGRKYRTEFVISSGGLYPIILEYSYNNQGNNENTVGGIIANRGLQANTFIADTMTPLNQTAYETEYFANGLPKNETVMPDQFYGNITRYWRHNFDEIIQKRGSIYYYHSAKGFRIAFDGLGVSQAYPYLRLNNLAAGEEEFSGYQLDNSKTQVRKMFDSTGKLRKIKRGPMDVLTLVYEDSILTKITNSQSASLTIYPTFLQSSSGFGLVAYPGVIKASNGTSAKLEWSTKYTGQAGEYHLLTRITEASASEAGTARDFEYNDIHWGASLTDIFTVNDIATNDRELYAHFEYDAQGRAIYSGLSNGVDAGRVDYLHDDTRIVTNALGKRATYTFANYNGVKRLQSVTGEPTQNCVSSEVSYGYDTSGNVSRKLQNGQVTEYEYDSLGREISRTEASGTPQARTILTEYHPTLNLPIRITSHDRVEVMTYDNEGRLLSKNIQSTTAPSP